METGTSVSNSGSSINESYEAIKNGSWFNQFCNGSNPWMARYVYGLIFLIANLLAWAARDYGRGALREVTSMYHLDHVSIMTTVFVHCLISLIILQNSTTVKAEETVWGRKES